MAFPGRPAHDFLLFFPVRRRAAFLHGPMPPPRAWGLSFLFRPVIGRGPCRRVVDARARAFGPWRLVMREAVMSGMVLAVIFKKGQIIKKVPESEVLDSLMEEIDKL